MRGVRNHQPVTARTVTPSTLTVDPSTNLQQNRTEPTHRRPVGFPETGRT
jgi:hypothetical protein